MDLFAEVEPLLLGREDAVAGGGGRLGEGRELQGRLLAPEVTAVLPTRAMPSQFQAAFPSQSFFAAKAVHPTIECAKLPKD